MVGESALTQSDKLLLLIEEACDRFPGAVWLPPYDHTQRIQRIDVEVIVSGAGDASALRAMERKGWIVWEPTLGKYACRITEDGRLRASTLA